jgi:hypothetical protein
MENETPKLPERCQRPVISHAYPLRMPCTFRVFRNGESIEKGSGQTELISSKTVLFKTSRFIAKDVTDVSVSVAWPVTLEDGTALQVVFSGRPMWVDDNFAGIFIRGYQFRTRRTAGDRLQVYRSMMPGITAAPLTAPGAGVSAA